MILYVYTSYMSWCQCENPDQYVIMITQKNKLPTSQRRAGAPSGWGQSPANY